jgi:HEAT repeats
VSGLVLGQNERLMNKSTVFGAALAVFAGVVILIGLLLLIFGGNSSDLASPESLESIAISGTPDEQEKAVLDLARYVPPNANAEKAKEALRRVLRESKVPQVRAAAIQGLGSFKDWESMDLLLQGLEDDDRYVRARSGVAVSEVLGVRYKYDPDDPVEERNKAIMPMKEIGLSFKKFKEKERMEKRKG